MTTDTRFWKLFGIQFHRIACVTERVAELTEELCLFPERPWRSLHAKINTPCGRCGKVVRVDESVCWLPAANGQASAVFHWPCAPKWTICTEGERAQELELARRNVK